VQFVFDNHVLDADRRELHRGSASVAVEPQVFDLLLHLVQNRDRVVSKDDLIASVWRGRIVSDSTLASRINAARRAIGDNGDTQRLIRTIARRGVRFVGSVDARSDAPAARVAPTVRAERPAIAVLPFMNANGEPEQDYFADGIAEDIITDLSKISSLFVIARNSAFIYKGKAVNLQKVGRELGVRYVLEGSVRKAGNRVRITAQLIDASSGGHVWAERYDRELIDIFEVQDEVTGEIVAALKVHLTPDERHQVEKHGTSSIEAHDRFLRGRQLFWQASRESVEQAQRLFEEAIRLDPAFCLAHAYLAFTLNLRSINGWSSDREGSSKRAQELIARALTLDPMEAEAHYVQGIFRLWQQKKVDQAIADIERAIALDPNFARGYGALGAALHYAGRSEEALRQFETMARLDPHCPGPYHHFWAQAHFALGHFEEAIAALKMRLAQQPHSDVSHVLLAACYGHLGRAEDARVEWEEALRVNPDYSIEKRRQILPYKNPADFEYVIEGLRKAGISA
jgi:adenylate cyclase